jgi:hypothetical protein
MSWARLPVVLAGFSSAIVPGIAAAAIVVASSGPSARNFPVGKKLDDNASVTLQAGDSVTILDAKGTRVLRGGGTISLKQSGSANTASAFAALTRQRSSARVRTGAVRGDAAATPVRSPNLWYVDMSKSGTVCVADAANVRLWRADTSKAASFTLSGAATAKASVSFPAGSMVAPWNSAQLPISDGASFGIADASGKEVARIAVALLPSAPATPEATATALIEKGCQAQLDLLALSLSSPRG